MSVVNNIIGKGEFGTVYKSTFNNDIVIKKFTNTKDYNIEKNINQQILPIHIGDININRILYFYTRCSFIHNLTKKNNIKFITNCNIISISDKQLIRKIKDVMIIDTEQITTISFDILNDSFLRGKTLNNDIINIGHVIKYDNTYKIYVDTFKINRLLDYNDIDRLLYFEYLGINLQTAFTQNIIPDFNHRVFMCIDLIRQINYLISRGIYHNDIKCENITFDNNYINIIDYGISISIYDKTLDDFLLTTNMCYSPEYYHINKKIIQKVNKISELKYLLDKSYHWIIGGIIINILRWKNIQYPIWQRYFHERTHIKIIKKYSNKNLCYKYVVDLLNELLIIEDLYIDGSYVNINIDNIIKDITKHYNIDIFENLVIILTKNITYYKSEYICFILCILNLLDIDTNYKDSMDNIYNTLKEFPGYLEYVELRKTFI